MFWVGLILGILVGFVLAIVWLRWFFEYAANHEEEVSEYVSYEFKKFLELTRKRLAKDLDDYELSGNNSTNPFTYNA